MSESEQPIVGPCGKRLYYTVRHARKAHQHASYRIRVYWCQVCWGYHATAPEKKGHLRLEPGETYDPDL